jgi:hypothetical protein
LYVRLFTPVAWTWYVVIGSLVTFASGWLLGLVIPRQTEQADP